MSILNLLAAVWLGLEDNKLTRDCSLLCRQRVVICSFLLLFVWPFYQIITIHKLLL